MIVSHRVRLRHVLHQSGASLAYFAILSVGVYVLHYHAGLHISLPFNGVAMMSTALAIYLGFKANQAYDRWWEGRKIWGLLVNYSRAFGREVLTFVVPDETESPEEVRAWQQRLLRRHMAFVHGLRVFLREPNGYVRQREPLLPQPNTYEDMKDFLDPTEYSEVLAAKNPPNQLILHQGQELKDASIRGWLSDYRFVQMSQTLTELNNHQGMAERIKNTPLPRPYTFYSRVFVFIHGTFVPFAFIEELTWLNIPLALAINFLFLSLDLVAHYTEDPFENRIADVPLTAISLTIEENLKEMARFEIPVAPLPRKPPPVEGVVF
ncbi:Hypothetical protein I5071_64780 [Sandaracinus amylolyticus]|nr:Hypothetical protein I5071_64780 [Sandaracinus amylolyticus]